MTEEEKQEKAKKDSLAKEEKKLKKELKELEKEEAEIKEEIKDKEEEIEGMPGKFSRICPHCKSFNVRSDFPISPAYGVADYVCLDCNFRGKVFPEINIHDKKEEKDRTIKEEEKVETEKEPSEEKTQEGK